MIESKKTSPENRGRIMKNDEKWLSMTHSVRPVSLFCLAGYFCFSMTILSSFSSRCFRSSISFCCSFMASMANTPKTA